MRSHGFDGHRWTISLVVVAGLASLAQPAAGQTVRIIQSDPIEIAAVAGKGSVAVDVLIPESGTATGLQALTPSSSAGPLPDVR